MSAVCRTVKDLLSDEYVRGNMSEFLLQQPGRDKCTRQVLCSELSVKTKRKTRDPKMQSQLVWPSDLVDTDTALTAQQWKQEAKTRQMSSLICRRACPVINRRLSCSCNLGWCFLIAF